MKFTKIIQQVVASLLLGCFILSNTPKTFLHNALAGHKDYIVICHHDSPCVHQQGVDCHFDNLVVNTQYITTGTISLLSLPNDFILTAGHRYASRYQPSWFCFRDYTGPPVFA